MACAVSGHVPDPKVVKFLIGVGVDPLAVSRRVNRPNLNLCGYQLENLALHSGAETSLLLPVEELEGDRDTCPLEMARIMVTDLRESAPDQTADLEMRAMAEKEFERGKLVLAEMRKGAQGTLSRRSKSRHAS